MYVVYECLNLPVSDNDEELNSSHTEKKRHKKIYKIKKPKKIKILKKISVLTITADT